ncbi:hypothetical protein [Sporomusa sp. KB1]|uniref:Mu transposase domain-containing protein n=1 Tax=Sporomusa sp. KB1 TaxID=943346 RepID=UPI00351B378A
MLTNCFEYLGGVPEELVFDQDKILAVRENYDDIIYTHEFEKFKQAIGFKVYLCRPYDPESKGLVKACIKYVKYNFAANRVYDSLCGWNAACKDWLVRTANRKQHGITKKVPSEVFSDEKAHLRPIPHTIKQPAAIITRQVRKDNTVLFEGNRYSVPVGTFKPGIEVEIKNQGNSRSIWDIEGETLIATHVLSKDKGKLIQNTNHRRDHSQRIDELYQKVLGILGNTEAAATLLDAIRKVIWPFALVFKRWNLVIILLL